MTKTFIGKVVSVKMNKTVVVEVIRKTPHPLYRKLIKRSGRYKADTGELILKLGDKVKVAETKPISKDKFFKVLEVIK
jgi:small subunit ribosomal protein S17